MSKPYMPFYWGDYLKDTAHLTARQHGVYLLLIGHYWEAGKPIAMLSQCYVIAKAFDADTRSDVDFIMSEFFQLIDGAYCHDRVDQELAKYLDKHEKRVSAGAKGASSRWSSEGQSHSNANSKANSKTDGNAIDEPLAKACHVIPESESIKERSTTTASRSVTLKSFLAGLKGKKESFVPTDDPLWEYLDANKMPTEWMQMAYHAFRARHFDGSKRYIDWRATFRNAVRENWLGLWRTGDHGIELTSKGQMAHNAYILAKRRAA